MIDVVARVFGPQKSYMRVPMQNGVVCHSVITRIGFKWKHFSLVTERHGSAMSFLTGFFNIHTPGVILPGSAMPGLLRQIRRNRP